MGTWQPLERYETPPGLLKEGEEVEVWGNETYQVIARTQPGSMTWLSIHRHDRAAIHDWRHLQQIKNEVCGNEREAIELYPAESRLADSANEYHLWALPEGQRAPIGFPEGLVTTDEQADEFTQDASHNGRQRRWQPGLTTGRNESSRNLTPEEIAEGKRLIAQMKKG